MKTPYTILALAICALFLCANAARAQASAQDESTDARPDSTQYAKQLSSGDPLTRQSGAEALARLAAVDQKKLVEGYFLQEKDKRVRLALNWALYRMGKSEVLFQIVHDLDSSRYAQALDYLTQLDSPEPLYLFLAQDNTPLKVTRGVLEVLGESGDAETVEKIKPFTAHYDPQVSAAAKLSVAQIQRRLAEPQSDVKTRPRAVTKRKEP